MFWVERTYREILTPEALALPLVPAGPDRNVRSGTQQRLATCFTPVDRFDEF